MHIQGIRGVLNNKINYLAGAQTFELPALGPRTPTCTHSLMGQQYRQNIDVEWGYEPDSLSYAKCIAWATTGMQLSPLMSERVVFYRSASMFRKCQNPIIPIKTIASRTYAVIVCLRISFYPYCESLSSAPAQCGDFLITGIRFTTHLKTHIWKQTTAIIMIASMTEG